MKKIYEELKGTEKECFDLLHNNQKAIDDNTEWVIAFYDNHTTMWGDDWNEVKTIMRKYPPESLTKYRRNLVEWGLITPSKASRDHSREMEAQNHKPDYIHNFENEIKGKQKSLIELRPITSL